MRTLLLAPELFVGGGGIPRILRLYLKALCELSEPGGQVGLIALNDPVADSSDLRKYSTKRMTYWETCARDKGRFVLASLRECRKTDLVICGHVAQLPVAWAAQRLHRKLRYTLVAHGIEVWRRFSLPERLALRSASSIWCVSDFTRREMLKFYPQIAAKTVVLPNALDPDFVTASLNPTPPELEILTISRLDRSDNYKGIDHLIEAMATIRREMPAARLRIVGRGNDQPRLAKIVRSLALEGAVTFRGYLSDGELRQELSTCRLFALPSQREGFGLVYLEAMAFGKPCVAARAGGAPEVITPESGVLVEYGNVPALAAACVQALRREWDALAIKARADAFSYFRFRDRLGQLLPLSA